MPFGPFYRGIGPHNQGEYDKVLASGEVWGLEPGVLATGEACVQAYPIDQAKGSNGYNFMTDVQPKESLGFPLDGPPIVREVFWFEGYDGVLSREDGKFAAIPVYSIRKGIS